MNLRFHNIESNSILASACSLDLWLKKMAFSDAAALGEAYRCLVNEMGGLSSTTANLEEIAGSSKVDLSLTTLCGKSLTCGFMLQNHRRFQVLMS